MRFTRRVGVKALLVVSVAATAGVLAATTLGSHGQQRWSGQWDFVHDSGVTGGFAFRHETDEYGATLLQQVGGTPCPEPTDYFAGGYTVPDGTPPAGTPPPGEFIDTGKIRACVVDGNPLHIRGRYESNSSGGDAGNIDLTLDGSGTSWTGTFTVDGVPGSFGWRGTFDKHFEDGADDPSNPPYGSATTPTEPTTTTDEEPPPTACRSGGPAPGCKPPPKCFGKAATIYPGEDDPFGVPLFGTAGKDVIVGSPGAEVIAGGGGDDLICGRGGNDVINGGGGADRVEGGPGDDRLNGGASSDLVYGSPGDDTIRGGARDDILVGGPGEDVLRYDAADVDLEGAGDVDGGPGVDRCIGPSVPASNEDFSSCEFRSGERS